MLFKGERLSNASGFLLKTLCLPLMAVQNAWQVANCAPAVIHTMSLLCFHRIHRCVIMNACIHILHVSQCLAEMETSSSTHAAFNIGLGYWLANYQSNLHVNGSIGYLQGNCIQFCLAGLGSDNGSSTGQTYEE